MKGTVYVHAAAGRALRQGGRALRLSDVVDCAGTFCRDDKIHIVVRGDDGGQNLVAVSRVELSISQLQHALRDLPQIASLSVSDWGDLAVCQASNIEWLWSTHWNE